MNIFGTDSEENSLTALRQWINHWSVSRKKWKRTTTPSHVSKNGKGYVISWQGDRFSLLGVIKSLPVYFCLETVS